VTAGGFFGFGPLAGAAYRERLMGKLPLRPGKGLRALDLGCGLGQEALYLAGLGYRVDAVDQSRHEAWGGVSRAVPGRIKFREGDATSLSLRSASYDLVFEKDMLHHASDPAAALREMARLAKPGGQVVAVEANRWNPLFYLHLTLMEGHQHFSLPRFRWLLQAAGMEGASLRRIEARVWPFEADWAQRVMDVVQDGVEKARLFGPWICYHAVSWTKPVSPGSRRK
jgi:SAM-dependent methyltransferase